MHIYVLKRPPSKSIYQVLTMVIVARDEAEARSLASTYASHEGPNEWLEEGKSKCECVGVARAQFAKAELLCRDERVTPD